MAIADAAGGSGAQERERLLAWARSGDPADPPRVAQALGDPRVLAMLDALPAPPPRRAGPRPPGVYDELFQALAAQPEGVAAPLLMGLLGDARFAAASQRSRLDPMTALLRASLRLPTVDAARAAAWRRHAQAHPDALQVLVDGLADHDEPAAVALQAELLGARRPAQAVRVDAVHAAFVPRRESLPTWRHATALLRQGGMSMPLKRAVAESLVARDPAAWFSPATWPAPRPPLGDASERAAARREFAQAALSLAGDWPAGLREDLAAVAR